MQSYFFFTLIPPLAYFSVHFSFLGSRRSLNMCFLHLLEHVQNMWPSFLTIISPVASGIGLPQKEHLLSIGSGALACLLISKHHLHLWDDWLYAIHCVEELCKSSYMRGDNPQRRKCITILHWWHYSFLQRHCGNSCAFCLWWPSDKFFWWLLSTLSMNFHLIMARILNSVIFWPLSATIPLQ